MEFKDYYEVLGVARDATGDAIKKNFRKLARKFHPDVSKEKDAETRMKEINEAYAVLSDPEKRAAYDQLGKGFHAGEEFRPPPDWDAGFEFSNHGLGAQEAAEFSEFFSRLFGGAGFAREEFGGRNRHASGEDHHAKVLLDIEDAFTGATRQITLRAPKVDARGRVSLVNRTLNVRIPKGVREAQVIRLAGQGGHGTGNAPAGDLLLEVHFKAHPKFSVFGRDLHHVLRLAPWEAALGAVIAVELPGGAVKVRVPAGAQAGKQLRVRAHGLPGDPPGDLLLDLQVVLPPAKTAKARELYQRMATEMAFDPRQA